jgi:hypothetical protein
LLLLVLTGVVVRLSSEWRYVLAEVVQSSSEWRHGLMLVLPHDLVDGGGAALTTDIPKLLTTLQPHPCSPLG